MKVIHQPRWHIYCQCTNVRGPTHLLTNIQLTEGRFVGDVNLRNGNGGSDGANVGVSGKSHLLIGYLNLPVPMLLSSTIQVGG